MGNHWLIATANDELQKAEYEDRWHQLPSSSPFGGVVYAAQAPLKSIAIEELLDDSTPDAYLVRINTPQQLCEVFGQPQPEYSVQDFDCQSNLVPVATPTLRMWSNSYDCIIASTLDEAKQIMRDYCGPMDEETMDGDGWYEVPLDSNFSMEVEDVGGVSCHTQKVSQWCEEFGPCYFGSTDW